MRYLLSMLATAILLASCAAPQLLGPASASFSDSNIREIQVLVSQRRDITQGVFKIWAETPDRVIIQSGSESHVDAEYSQFTAVKKNGHWKITSLIQRRHLYGTG